MCESPVCVGCEPAPSLATSEPLRTLASIGMRMGCMRMYIHAQVCACMHVYAPSLATLAPISTLTSISFIAFLIKFEIKIGPDSSNSMPCTYVRVCACICMYMPCA